MENNYSNYHSSQTISYKQGFIHVASFGSNEVIKVSVDKYAYLIYVKSVHAAKILITKHANKYGG